MSLEMAGTSLHPPDEVYGEYATANGLDVSNDGTDTPCSEMLPDPAFDVSVEVLGVTAAAGAGVLSDAVGS